MATTIKLDISNNAKDLLAQRLSSADYNNLLQSGLAPADLLLTYPFRWVMVIARDLPAAHGTPSGTNGPTVELMAKEPVLAAFTTFAFLAIALANAYDEYQKLKHAREQNSYKYIYESLSDTPKDNLKQQNDKQTQDINVANDVNFYLQKILNEDDYFKNKYQRLQIDFANKDFQLVVENKQKEEEELNKQNKVGFFKKIINKVLSPAWESLFLMSYTYWILWMGTGIFTGSFGVGVGGLPNVVSLGVPLLTGLGYIGKKVYHYFQDKKKIAVGENLAEETSSELMKEVQKDAYNLLRRALLRREFELEKERLQKQILSYGGEIKQPAAEQAPLSDVSTIPSAKKEIDTLRKSKWKKTAGAFIMALCGTFVCSQYITWYVTDFLKIVANVSIAAPVANVAVGAVLVGITGARAIYNAYERYKEVKKYGATPKATELQNQQAQVTNLEERLDKSQKNINTYEGILRKSATYKAGESISQSTPYFQGKHFTLADTIVKGEPKKAEPKLTFWEKCRSLSRKCIPFCRQAFQFLDGACTGVFVGRLLFVKGTALALPCAVAVLSNPITIGILAGLGLAYGAFKLYQYHQKCKEERAKQLLAEIKDLIIVLQQKVEISELREKLLLLQTNKKEVEPSIALAEETEASSPTVSPPPKNDIYPSKTEVSVSKNSYDGFFVRENSDLRDPLLPEENRPDVSCLTPICQAS